MSITFVGDIHGEFGKLNTFINKKHPETMICLGDFAYYFFENEDNTGRIKPQNTKVYWLPGNHDNFDKIESLHGRRGESPIEIEPNIFYCPIGSSINIDGKEIMFVGGADSIDKRHRIMGLDWWQQELLNQEDLDYVLNRNIKVDIICSHTCPTLFNLPFYDTFRISDETTWKANDPSKVVLDRILEQFKPDYYYFGHYHDYMTGQYENTKWMGLSMINHSKWWDKQDYV